MINFDNYYRIAEEEIELIEAMNQQSIDYPYVLTVQLKSGKRCSISYKDSKSRDSVRDNIVKQVETEKRAVYAEKIVNRLNIIDHAINRIEKRQLRIWRQLKALLGVSDDE